MNACKPLTTVRLAFVVLLVFAGWLSPAAGEQAPAPPGPDGVIPFSLAISGGISLGSYEAGLNWALLRSLKNLRRYRIANEPGRIYPELMSAGGASAGSINALLSALSWCLDDDKLAAWQGSAAGDRIDDNLFRFLWLNVGIDEMLPRDQSKYGDGDALLTRSALAPAIAQIRRRLVADIYRDDCYLPIGITVTRVDPARMSIAGVEVQNQRFIIPIRLQSRPGGGIEFVSHAVNRDDPALGNIMYLRETRRRGETYAIDHADVIDAILASSAYPLAFGEVELRYCADLEGNDGDAERHECPDGFEPRVDAFIDGGVFDNVPLGAARALAEPRENDLLTRQRWEQSARPYSYVYIDPDNRRAAGQRSTDTAAAGVADGPIDFFASGIRTHFKFLGGAVSTGRNYELYNVLRSGDWSRHSYDYICRLLDEMGINSGSERQCETELDPGADLCETLRATLDLREPVAAAQQLAAAACLLRDRQRLERIYYDYKGNRITADEITQRRADFLRRLQRLARQNGRAQLALSIENLKRDKLGDRRILLTQRFAPITGNMLSAFGAFIDRPFREFDYYAGVYDAVNGIADFRCGRRFDYRRCLARQSKAIFDTLEIGRVADARTVFFLLATLEHADYADPGSPWRWLADPAVFAGEPRAGNMAIVFAALTQANGPVKVSLYVEPGFTDFIQTLFERGYDVSESSRLMQRIYRLRNKRPRTWYYPLTSRISERMLDIERESDDQFAPLMRSSIGLGAFALHSYVEDEESKLLIRSAAPADTWVNWLPYEIGADLRNGGLIVSWLPGVELGERTTLDLKITPYQLNRYSGEDIWFSQLDLLLSYRREGVITSIGAGPTWTYTHEGQGDAEQEVFGASVYVAMFQDKLRFTLGKRARDSDDFAGESTFFAVTIMDIPGFVYWLSQGR